MDKINDASSKFTFLFKKRLRDSEVVSLCGSSTLSFVNVLKSKKEKETKCEDPNNKSKHTSS